MQPPVTVVVVPRERFSRSEISLECLYRNTPKPFDLIYVDGHSPPRLRTYLEQHAGQKRFQLIRVPHFVPDPQLRNIGLREVKTPYVVFIENDVLVRAGWLQALLDCAAETKAPLVGPLYIEHLGGRDVVHMAGGVAHLEDVDGRRRCIERHRFPGRHISEVAHDLRRQPTELIEFHCVLMRTDVLRERGGFDEGVKNTAEHVDLCLTMGQAGHEIYLEPASVVELVQPPPFSWYDVPFYCTRWNDAWSRQTLAHFAGKWRLDPDDPFLSHKHNWTRSRRRQIFDYFLTRARITSVGRRAARRYLLPIADGWVGKTIARRTPPTPEVAARE